MLRTLCVPILLAAAVTTAAIGQSRNATPGRTEVRCGTSFEGDLESYCETWQETAAVSGPLDIDARPNGGIQVRGADRRDALVKAEINAHADTIDRARCRRTNRHDRGPDPCRGAAARRRRILGSQLRDRSAAAQPDHPQFPITLSGNISRRQITTRLGSGGARIRAYTRNGGVTVERR